MTFEPVDDPQQDVFEEKGFRHVLRKALFVVGSNGDLFLVVWMLGLGTFVTGFALSRGLIAGAALTADLVRGWAGFGLAFSTAVLGFLITGFSIFATITKPEVFRLLASVRRSDRDISQFKFIFFNFLYIFFNFLVYVALCMALIILLEDRSPLWLLVNLFYDRAPRLFDFGAAEAALILGCYTAYLLLILRSFIWNLYQSLLISIFAE